MRSPRNVLIAALVLVVVGLALVVLESDSYFGYSVGPTEDNGSAYSSDVSIAFDNGWLVSTQALTGYALMWLGTLLAAAVVGFRLAAKRPASP